MRLRDRLLLLGIAIVAAVAPVCAQSPELASGKPLAVSTIRLILAGVLCLILIGVLIWTRRRMTSQPSGPRFQHVLSKAHAVSADPPQLVSQQRLTGGLQLLVIRWNDREFLVTAAPGQACVVAERTAQPVEGANHA